MRSIEERIIGVVAQEMGREKGDITLETELVRDLGVDSIDAQAIMIELVELVLEFGNFEYATVDDLVRMVEQVNHTVDHEKEHEHD